MSLHPKIDSRLLTSSGLLLNASELRLVQEIQSFVKNIRTEADLLHQAKDELKKTIELLAIANDLYQYIDQMLVPKQAETQEEYQQKISNELNELLALTRYHATRDFINDLKANFQHLSIQEYFYETYLDCFNDTWSKHEDDVPDIILRQDMQAQEDELTKYIDTIENRLKNKISQFKSVHKVDFELDEEYQLVKISKRTNKLNHSVIYIRANDDASPAAFALYRGGEGQMLGEGGFGKVKLCQKIDTGEWMAIKIQQRMLKEMTQNENKALQILDRFAGDATRNTKYYSVQTLLPGVDLYKHMQNNPSDSIETRLMIAEKAAHLVSEFHQTFLHRDLKPENFIWDNDKQELYLCDFGMAIEISNHQDGILDLSGSGTYLAPEIDDAKHKGNVKYTKKTDIYALGKVFNELFKDIQPVPANITELIDKMTKANADERVGDAEYALLSLQTIMQNKTFSNQ